MTRCVCNGDLRPRLRFTACNRFDFRVGKPISCLNVHRFDSKINAHGVYHGIQYQQTQPPRVEKQMQKASHIASFIGHRAGRALFVGLFENRGNKMTKLADRLCKPEVCDLPKYGHINKDCHCLWFDFVLARPLSDWSGKLIVSWPPPEIAWTRWCSKNEFKVQALLEESLLAQAMPVWRELVFTWNDLKILPATWRAKLGEWRGVYFILDTSDGKGYVGSAYGAENIRHRWENYAKSGHGGNKLLKTRKSENLRFSILERVSPDTPPEVVIQLEETWKKRLHTCEHGLNT
jgi:hypothetical protein